jgi:hypothetical protein
MIYLVALWALIYSAPFDQGILAVERGEGHVEVEGKVGQTPRYDS